VSARSFSKGDILVNNASALDTPMKRFDLMHSIDTRNLRWFEGLHPTLKEELEPAHPHERELTAHFCSDDEACAAPASPTSSRINRCRVRR
jgi:hypothetical protein